jgi:hypothetical protein
VARVAFTQNLRQHLGSDLPAVEVDASTVSAALSSVFELHPRMRGYVLDDQGAVRKHIAVFVDGESVADRSALSDSIGESSEVFVSQALSGG